MKKICKWCGEVLPKFAGPNVRYCPHKDCKKLKTQSNRLQCVVCGGDARGKYNYNQTCGAPPCRSILLLNPKLSDSTRGWNKNGDKPNNKPSLKKKRDLLRQIHLDSGNVSAADDFMGILERLTRYFDVPATGFDIDRRLIMAFDERGDDRPEAQQAIYSFLSRRTVLIRIESRFAGSAGIVLRRGQKETIQQVIKEKIMGGSGRETMAEVFLAWQCSCSYCHRIEYTTVDDLPSEYGWHDACPQCGAAPVEVKPYEKS